MSKKVYTFFLHVISASVRTLEFLCVGVRIFKFIRSAIITAYIKPMKKFKSPSMATNEMGNVH